MRGGSGYVAWRNASAAIEVTLGNENVELDSAS
jgi:hypothetical protein